MVNLIVPLMVRELMVKFLVANSNAKAFIIDIAIIIVIIIIIKYSP